MGLSAERARGSLRFSFGRFNSDADMEQACVVLLPAVIGNSRQLNSGTASQREVIATSRELVL